MSAAASASAPRRLLYLLAGWGSVGTAYTFGAQYAAGARPVPELALDAAFGHLPGAIWVYLSFFLFIPYAYARAPAARLPWLMLAMQGCAVVAAIAFALWPTTAGSVPAHATPMLRWLASMDSPANCLPSLHGALSLLCAWALLQDERPLHSALMLAWAGLICWSAIALRRHLVFDLGAGIVLGALCGAALLPARRWRPSW